MHVKPKINKYRAGGGLGGGGLGGDILANQLYMHV